MFRFFSLEIYLQHIIEVRHCYILILCKRNGTILVFFYAFNFEHPCGSFHIDHISSFQITQSELRAVLIRRYDCVFVWERKQMIWNKIFHFGVICFILIFNVLYLKLLSIIILTCFWNYNNRIFYNTKVCAVVIIKVDNQFRIEIFHCFSIKPGICLRIFCGNIFCVIGFAVHHACPY